MAKTICGFLDTQNITPRKEKLEHIINRLTVEDLIKNY